MFSFLQSFKGKFTVIFVLLISTCFIIHFMKPHPYNDKNITQSVTEFKGCMNIAGNLYKNESKIFFQEFNKCIKKHISIKEKYFDKFGENNETEIFLPLIGKEEDCRWLTVGIDQSIKIEQNFKEKYPQCLIFGADPYPPKNGFSSIAKVFSFGVDLDNTFNTTIVSVNGTKMPKEVQVYSIPNLLINFIHSRIIYYLKIDIEGYEYKLLESLVGNERYANAGLTFCQISVILHNPKMPSIHPAAKNLYMVEFIISFLQHSSPYIPVRNAAYNTHQKITFINIRDPLCEMAFKVSRYFL